MIMLRMNLQLFAQGAGEKTEKATPKRRQDARKKGQVFQSREITSALVLMLVFISLRIFGGFIYNEIAAFTRKLITEYSKAEDLFSTSNITVLFLEIAAVLLKVIAPVLVVAVVAGLLSGYAQVGFLFTTKTLAFKFDRINPLSGLKRIFSIRSITELFKSIFKILIVGYLAYSFLDGEKNYAINLMDSSVPAIASYIGQTALNLGIRICIALIILGVLDYAYQWWDYEKSLKMSKQEIKEEFKQVEGNPEIKSKIKQKQRQISMRRMLQDVPKADVIITNPTHFAVAIKYDASVSDAPLVTAKGQDFIAQRIKEVARENKVEIVENKPLARTLYEKVEIGESIPPDLFQAVAEVLAFVYSLKGS